jgi:hypothetical protein
VTNERQGASRRFRTPPALAAGIAANPHDQEPVASAIPLTYFSNDAYGVAHERQRESAECRLENRSSGATR